MRLTVLLTTHNHARSVERAVGSALTQQTCFPYEVIVVDDSSIDGTQEVIGRLCERHPGRIRPIFHEQHVGLYETAREAYQACDGRYLALLDGSDYWISPTKLQRQVDFLDSHEDVVACFHNALIVSDDGNEERLSCPSDQKEMSEIEELLLANFIPRSCPVYRAGVIREFPEWGGELEVGEWVLNVLQARHGRIGYISDTMAVVRRHRGWTEPTEAKIRATTLMYIRLNEYLGFKYDTLIRALIPRWEAFHKVEELRARFRKTEVEWRRHLEQLRLERTAAVNELFAQVEEARREKQAVEREREHLLREKEAGQRETAALREQLERQGGLLEELARSVEALARHEADGVGRVEGKLSEIHRWVVLRWIREVVGAVVPPKATVLVVSKGDEELLDLDGRRAWHFPQTQDGSYAGHHPADSAAAIEQLEALRARGAKFLLFPGSSLWWLDHYREFKQYLEARYGLVVRRANVCAIYALEEGKASDGLMTEALPRPEASVHEVSV